MLITNKLLQHLVNSSEVSPNFMDCLERNEQGDAELFAYLLGDAIRYDHADKQWYLWTGSYWKPDKVGEVYGMVANQVSAEYIKAASQERSAGNKERSKMLLDRSRHLLTKRRIDSVIGLASRIRGIALEGSEWDMPPMCLPVSNGVINLETGNFREPNSEDYVRHYTPTEWHGLNCSAPTWENVLLDIFNNDEELLSFIQRLFGYAITGDTREQILPILWGEGANGKSTIKDVITSVLGRDICFVTQTDSLMDFGKGDGNAPRPFVYALRNKRLVWASESREGQRLNSSLVKQLTGDDYITARTLHSLPVQFKQTHKIFLITNHSPRVPDGDDQALWRRIIRIPFPVRFVENPKPPNERQRDKNLEAKLKDEFPGILAWLVRGCLEWQRQGLNPPESVVTSTDRYRQEEDLIGRYIEERLVLDDGQKVALASIYKDYTQWCDENGHRPISAITLGKKLTKRFGESVLARLSGKKQRVYEGLCLVQD